MIGEVKVSCFFINYIVIIFVTVEELAILL